MREMRSGAGAMAVELAGALLLATAVFDALGHAGVSFYLLVLAVPATAIAGLSHNRPSRALVLEPAQLQHVASEESVLTRRTRTFLPSSMHSPARPTTAGS